MQSIITIFRDVQDPRDINARHILSSMLFISLAATLCGAKSSVDIADFADAHVDTLGEIVDLPYGAPSHDCFSRIFRLLDPEELATALTRFAAALRHALGIGPAMDRAGDAGRLAVAEGGESGGDGLAGGGVAVVARGANAPALPGLVAIARLEAERRVAGGKLATAMRCIALSKRLSPARVLE